MHRLPMYYTTNLENARSSVELLASLQPERVITGHGPAMQGAQMRDALHQLASNFDHLAVPEGGGNAWRNPPPNERAVSFVSPEFQKQEAGSGRSRSFTRLLAIDPTGATARLAPCRSALVVPAGDEFRLRGAAPSRCGNTRRSGRFVSVAWWIWLPSVPWLGDEVPVAMRQSSQSGGQTSRHVKCPSRPIFASCG